MDGRFESGRSRYSPPYLRADQFAAVTEYQEAAESQFGTYDDAVAGLLYLAGPNVTRPINAKYKDRIVAEYGVDELEELVFLLEFMAERRGKEVPVPAAERTRAERLKKCVGELDIGRGKWSGKLGDVRLVDSEPESWNLS